MDIVRASTRELIAQVELLDRPAGSVVSKFHLVETVGILPTWTDSGSTQPKPSPIHLLSALLLIQLYAIKHGVLLKMDLLVV